MFKQQSDLLNFPCSLWPRSVAYKPIIELKTQQKSGQEAKLFITQSNLIHMTIQQHPFVGTKHQNFLPSVMFKMSFSPIVPLNSRILILGSLPGDRSLAAQQYYAHPQNRFWKILHSLYNRKLPTTYAEKLSLLQQEKIALWDVCQSAQREGSMDTEILAEVPNPISTLLQENPGIETVCFNGKKAQSLYDKYFERYPNITYYGLPSSSPANASFNEERLLEQWAIILQKSG